MDWYVVIKTIKGRRYYYRQKTWREGTHVRTQSQYIGPVDGGEVKPEAGQAQPATLSTKTINDSFVAITGKVARGWTHHWSARRQDEVLVARDEKVDAVINGLGVYWTDYSDGAYYNPRTQRVNIPPLRCFKEKHGQSATAAYYIVVFHELVHWTLPHTKRPNGDYAREELVAELGAVMLMKHFGIDIGYTERHAYYFQLWLARSHHEREDALIFAKREAARAVRFILKRGTMRT
jgi:antirestriction protein ArdC